MAPRSGGHGRSQRLEICAGSNATVGGNSSSTQRWNVPRGTMDEVSSYVRLNLPSHCRQGRPKDCSASSSNPMMEGPWCRVRREARARERHRHWSGVVDSLKALDPDGRLEKRTSEDFPKVQSRDCSHSPNGRYGTSAQDALLWLDVGGPDHLGPLVGVVGDELAKVGGRHRH
jgi:hypothetical protein